MCAPDEEPVPCGAELTPDEFEQIQERLTKLGIEQLSEETLHVLVALVVGGCNVTTDELGEHICGCDPDDHRNQTAPHGMDPDTGEATYGAPLAFYHHDSGAALHLADMLVEYGTREHFALETEARGWQASFDEGKYLAVHGWAALAISLAALKSRGLDVPERSDETVSVDDVDDEDVH